MLIFYIRQHLNIFTSYVVHRSEGLNICQICGRHEQIPGVPCTFSDIIWIAYKMEVQKQERNYFGRR